MTIELSEYVIDAIAEAVAKKIKALEQEPCEDAISRQAAIEAIYDNKDRLNIAQAIRELPSVKQEPKTGHCKDCKYFEYDSPAIVDGIPLIVAHEICSKWGGGCKTCEDGYCFMFEQRMENGRNRHDK